MEQPKCPSCTELYNFSTKLPRKLQCGHILCSKCITDNLAQKQAVTCSSCNQASTPDLNSLEIAPEQLNLMPIRVQECVLHSGEAAQMFCTRDKTLVCNKCKVESEHRDHEIRSLSESVDIYQIQMNLYTRVKRNLVATLQHNIEQMQEAIHNNDMSYELYKKKMNSAFQQIKEKLNEIQKTREKQAQTQYDRTKTQLSSILQLQQFQLNFLSSIPVKMPEDEFKILQHISWLEHIKNNVVKINFSFKYSYNAEIKEILDQLDNVLKLTVPYNVKNERLDFQDNYIVSQFPQQCSGDLITESSAHDIYFKSYAYIQKSRIVTFSKDSQILNQYSVQTKDFSILPLNISPTYKNATYIHQVNNDTIIISGISQGEDSRFTVVSGDQIKNFKMNNARGYHRTVTHNFAQFNQFEDDSMFDVYIIGGCKHDSVTQQNVTVAEIEKFNLVNEGSFVKLAPMPLPVFSFGCGIYKNKIYVFGGIVVEGVENQLTSKIQIYNIRSNEWTFSKTKLPKQAAANSIYLSSLDCLLVYNNTTKAYLDATYLFNPKTETFEKHGPVFPGTGPAYTASYVDEDRVFQFDNEGKLFCYDIKLHLWNEIKNQ